MSKVISKYQVVSNLSALKRVIAECKKQGPTALDFETTALVPREGKVRLVSLCNRKVHALVDFDAIGRDAFRKNAKLFEGGKWVVFNVGFEARWFFDAQAKPILWDLGNMRRAILGGGSFSLARLCEWDLNETMDKEEQRSDWSQPHLTQSQLDYAYKDADITWRLWLHWSEQADADRWRGFNTLNDMYPAVIEMEDAGMLLDHDAHRKLIDGWSKIKLQRMQDIRSLVSEEEVANINSDSQWSDYFSRNSPESFTRGWPRTEKTGQLSMTTETLKLLAAKTVGTPLELFFDALAAYKTISKYLNSFGDSLINASNLTPDKRIRARFNIGYAKTGRFSSSSPNLQQVPRDKELLGSATSVRSSFVAGLGRRLVSLDYSGIELRVLALLSNDDQLLQDVVYGDVHAEVAAKMAGRAIDKNKAADKALRSKAKGVSFGIIYGSGAAGLAGTMRTTPNKAQEYIDFWAKRYENAFNYRYQMLDEAMRTRYIKTVDGGTIYMGKNPELPRCANYPVQRAALSVMARAIVRHKSSLEALRGLGEHRLTRMLATIHDALITETASANAEEVLSIMRKDMILGYRDIFPDAPTDALVEGGVGLDWSALG
jgi:DNA polymerase-1